MLVALLTPPFFLFSPFEQYCHGCDPPDLPTLIPPLTSAFLASYLHLLAIQKFPNLHGFHIGLGTLNLLDFPSDTPPYSQALLSFPK